MTDKNLVEVSVFDGGVQDTGQPSVERFTPGPWSASQTYPPGDWCIHARGIPWQLAYLSEKSQVAWPLEANARLIAAAPSLYEAAALLEAAEAAHANCPECDGEIMPELCPACFPLFDDARLKRRAALAKAVPQTVDRTPSERSNTDTTTKNNGSSTTSEGSGP